MEADEEEEGRWREGRGQGSGPVQLLWGMIGGRTLDPGLPLTHLSYLCSWLSLNIFFPKNGASDDQLDSM